MNGENDPSIHEIVTKENEIHIVLLSCLKP